jgi:hypothetical protein
MLGCFETASHGRAYARPAFQALNRCAYATVIPNTSTNKALYGKPIRKSQIVENRAGTPETGEAWLLS